MSLKKMVKGITEFFYYSVGYTSILLLRLF